MKVIVISHQNYDIYAVSCVLKETDLDMYIKKYRKFAIEQLNKSQFNIDRNLVYTEKDITTIIRQDSVAFQYDIPEYTIDGLPNFVGRPSMGCYGFDYTIHEVRNLNFMNL